MILEIIAVTCDTIGYTFETIIWKQAQFEWKKEIFEFLCNSNVVFNIRLCIFYITQR